MGDRENLPERGERLRPERFSKFQKDRCTAENNIPWERNGQTIRASAVASLAEREVFSLPRDAIHSVTNPVAGYTCAIHVYGGDLSATKLSQWDALTLREEPFDVEAGRKILQEADQRFAGE